MHILESFIWGFYIIAVYNLRPTNLGHANPQTRILQCWIVQCGILQNRIIRCGILQCGFYIVRYYKSQTAGLWIMNPNPHLPVLHIWGSYNLGSINAGCFNVGSCDVGFYKIRATDLESVRRSSVLYILGSCNAGSDNVGYYNAESYNVGSYKGRATFLGSEAALVFSIEPYYMISPKHQKQNAKQAQQTNHNKWHIAKWLERRAADLVQCQVRRRLDCSQPNHHVACATWSFEVAAYVSSCLFIIALPGLADRNLASPTFNTGAPRALTKSIFRLVSEKHRGSCCSVITPGSLAEAAGFYFCWVHHR